MSDNPVVETKYGQIMGVSSENGIHAFFGIPYAQSPDQPPFEAPKSPENFDEIFDARSYGPTAPQSRGTAPLTTVFPEKHISGKNYLNVNIWTNNLTTQKPVMIFIHGGSFTSGSGAIDGYNGTAFAEKGIVLVTLNYRLGIQGFAYTEDGELNIGLLDQIQGIKWVKETISSFGGDPNNITLFGESAGAMSIGALLAMPATDGLFQRAILESGAASHCISLDSAKKISQRLGEILGIKMTKAHLASIPIDQILAAQQQISQELSQTPHVSKWGDVAYKGLAFEPIVDGIHLPAYPSDLNSMQDDRQLLIGFNHEEANILFAPTQKMDNVRGWFVYYAAFRYQLPIFRTAQIFNALNPLKKAQPQATQLLTDIIYRVPGVRLAQHFSESYVYEFNWRSPAFDGQLGAAHGVELPFVFNNLDAADWSGIVGADKDHQLADNIQNAWINFAKNGHPGWKKYRNYRDIHDFGLSISNEKQHERQLEFVKKHLTVL